MISLADVFFAEGASPADAGEQIMEASERLAKHTAVKELGRQLPQWSPAARELEAGLKGVLGVDLQDVLMSAWTTYEDLREYADPAKHPRDEDSTYTVGEHSIGTNYHPKLEVRVNGAVMGTIEFDVDLDVTFEYGQLLIRNGRIYRATAGHAVASGTIKIAGEEMAKVASRPLNVPLSVSISDGLAIAP